MDEITPTWWCMDSDILLTLLRRVADGEDPDMVYAEQYANADIEYVDGD